MKVIFSTFKIVYGKILYVLVSVFSLILLLLIDVTLINRGVVSFVMDNDFLDAATRFKIFMDSLADTGSILRWDEIILIIFITILSSISITFLIFFIKNQVRRGFDNGLSFMGVVLSLFGVGCLSCGSALLISLLGISTASAIIGFLPLKGVEFSIISVVLLFWSIHLVSKKIQNPEYCKIN